MRRDLNVLVYKLKIFYFQTHGYSDIYKVVYEVLYSEIRSMLLRNIATLLRKNVEFGGFFSYREYIGAKKKVALKWRCDKEIKLIYKNIRDRAALLFFLNDFNVSMSKICISP